MKKCMLILCALLLTLLLTGCGCKHEETTIINAKDPTCEEAGYSGDTKCLKCEEIVAQGSEIAPAGHAASERLYAQEGTCQTLGYTGDIYCTHCQAVLEQGQSTDFGEHVPGKSREDEPTCESAGWYSSIKCAVCGELLREEHTLPALGHSIPELEGYIEPTCTEEGYSGDGWCATCGQWVKGKTLDCTPHPYDHGRCTVCGYRQPGLFDDEFNLIMDWDTLIDEELLLYQDVYGGDHRNCIYGVSDQLTGTLVVAPDHVFVLYDPFYWGDTFNQGMECNLERIIFTETQEDLGLCSLRGLTRLESVEIYSEIGQIGCDSLRDCSNLKSVVMTGQQLTHIQDRAFSGCSSLERVVLPEGLTVLGQSVFMNCTSLTEIEVPASMTHFFGSTFAGCTALEKAVVNCAPEKVSGDEFSDCLMLKEIMFAAECNAKSLKLFNAIRENSFSIFYRGTEAQWNELGGSEFFPNAAVTFNYTGE